MRDIPFGVLHLYLAFYLFKICIETGNIEISRKQLIIIFILGLLLAIYRGEGWIILLTALFALYIYGKFNTKLFIKSIICALIAFPVLDSFLPKLLNVSSVTKNTYKLTLVAYPLGFILREGNYKATGLRFTEPEGKNYMSSDYDEDKRILSKVINIKAIQDNTNSYDIMDFQHEGNYWNRDATDEDWKEFYNRTYKIFWDNPHLFLAARTANFVSQLFIPKNRAERTNDIGRFPLTYNE
jgi:hypothetical protein